MDLNKELKTMITSMNEIISKVNVKSDGNKSKNISFIKIKLNKENTAPIDIKSSKEIMLSRPDRSKRNSKYPKLLSDRSKFKLSSINKSTHQDEFEQAEKSKQKNHEYC